MSEPPAVPQVETGLSREVAVTLRESFDPAEREAVQSAVADLLDLLGRAHAMAVLSEFAYTTRSLRFRDLEESLEVAPKTLSARLADLTEADLLEREAYDEIPPRVEYTPTEKAEALFPVFGHLHPWAIQYGR
ncbi:winged helix-turn-helix transcriptional regulator [Halobacteriales archaeon Cl-PHB]